MKKNTKLKVISAAVFLLAFNNSAYAQWATIDAANVAQSTITAAKSTLSAAYNYYTMLSTAANGQGIQQQTQAINVMNNQSIKNLETQDLMNRKAMGDAKLASIAYEMLPTLSACEEASGNTPNSPKSAAGRAAASGGGGGTQGSPARSKSVTSTIAAQAQLLKEQKDIGTCIDELSGAAECSGNGKLAGADMHPRGVKGNVENIPRNEEDGPAYKNYSLEGDAWKAAKKYAADMAYYDKPKVPTKDQLAKNPVYASMYKSVQTKLDAAHDSVLDIARFKKASLTDISKTIPGKMWAEITPEVYTQVTGAKTKPTGNPSMYELVNFNVNNDYYGKIDPKLQTIEEVNKRLALSNYLGWQQYKQQENTNILLAHMVVQLTTPVNKAQVDAEYSKTMGAR